MQSSFNPRTRSRLRIGACALLFIAALFRYWVSYDSAASVPRHPETFRIAYSIYEHGQFANPFIAADTGPSAHLAPFFPVLLAVFMKIFGVRSVASYAIQLTEWLVLSLQLSLYPVFSRTLGMGSLTGFIAALAWILAKPDLLYGWEAFYASLALAGACCLFRRQLDLRQPNGSTWALGGLMGFSTLLVPTALPVFAAWVVWDLWRRRAALLNSFLLPLVVLPALIVLPWTVRNYYAFHRFVLVRDDLGLELAVSNNDCAQFSMQQNFNGCFQQFHPNRSVAEAKKVVDIGEVDYNHLRLDEALLWIKTHPHRFAWLSTCRFVAWWMPTENGTLQFVEYAGRGRLLQRFVIYLMTLLSIPGLLILSRRDFKSSVVCIFCLFFFPIVYYFVQFQDRYRYPVMWLTFLLGAFPLSILVTRLFSTEPHRYSTEPEDAQSPAS